MLKLFMDKLSHTPQKTKDVAASYQIPPSISEKLPWMEYDAQHQCFCLEDGRSVAAVFEISGVSADAKGALYLQQLQQGLQGVFQDVFPLYFDDASPWIIQFYLQDELCLNDFYENCKDYIKPALQETEFTKNYLELLKTHTEFLTRPEGVFLDTKVSGMIFRGKIRKIRAVIYRRLHRASPLRRHRSPIQDLNTIAQRFTAKLEACGFKVTRYGGKQFYEWMVSWFNPAPIHGDSQKLLAACPYPGDEQLPWGYDFSQQLFFSVPRSDEEKGIWYFDNLPHKYLSILGLRTLPESGHLTLERQFGNFYFGLFDKFPAGSIFTLTIVLQSQEAVKNHIFRIEQSTKRATSTEAEMAREDCALAKRAIESGNYFFPTSMGVYILGNTIEDLYNQESEVETILSSNGFIHLNGDHELIPLEAYLQYLPMNYSFHFDKNYLLRSRYLSGKQLSDLLPVYGRERGSKHQALTFFNRGGEPLTFDPFHPQDKDFNSHLLLLGTTGSGKSALCIYMMMQLMAVHRPRLVIVDAGNSFGLLSEYFKSLNLTVNRVAISFNDTTSLNPFSESDKLLSQLTSKSANLEEIEKNIEEELQHLSDAVNETEKVTQENRDYLGEMLLAAELMITGGEKKEAALISREDRYWILKAVVHAAQQTKTLAKNQMIASDVIESFHHLAGTLEQEGKASNQKIIGRLKKMAAHMDLFCQDPLSAKYFNTKGNPWPEADVTFLEMGIFKDEGYEAQRALAFMGAMNKTVSVAEAHQYEERFTVLFADECHILTTNPLTSLAITRCAKMSRKIGLHLWFATQNMEDFPDTARKTLSMIEFYLCLGTSAAELESVERFKPLTEEERALFRSVRKEAKKYVEGVLLCHRFKTLFRVVLPRLVLALAMTEKHEKAERKKIMEAYHCTELEAAMKIAKDLLESSTSA